MDFEETFIPFHFPHVQDDDDIITVETVPVSAVSRVPSYVMTSALTNNNNNNTQALVRKPQPPGPLQQSPGPLQQSPGPLQPPPGPLVTSFPLPGDTLLYQTQALAPSHLSTFSTFPYTRTAG